AGVLPAQENNDFYDNEPFVDLPLKPLEVAGEVAAPGRVELAGLPLRSVMVREAVTQKGKPEFVGSYVFQGYSLFDILRERTVAKKNEKEFRSVIDLLIVVENAKGDKAVFSWGEIFYPTAPHRILVAVKAAAIVPSLTKERWPLPGKARLAAADDLVADRNLEDPVRITVLSAPLSFPVQKGKSPLRAASFRVVDRGRETGKIEHLPEGVSVMTLPSVFFGRGRGFHGITEFAGVPLRTVLARLVPSDSAAIRRGFLVLAGDDGYRAVVSASELFNRNDNGEFLLCDRGDKDGGRFSVYPGPDFFSDRAVKALKEIHYLTVD
ncbi:MAG TPA: hypothetical protein VHP61_08320, partial [Acidobacteriota bacterium]|nr:hypothetical protein [Acidobacteriota bacterium]